MAAQGLLEVVERCLEGTEEVTNPNDVEYAVDDVHHSFDGVVDVHLVHDALLNFDVGLLLDVYLDDLLGLDAMMSSSLQSLMTVLTFLANKMCSIPSVMMSMLSMSRLLM